MTEIVFQFPAGTGDVSLLQNV